MTTALDAALEFIGRGWNPVPIKRRKKEPIGEQWQTRVIDRNSAPQHFNGAALNVGVMLGVTSRGLTDIDLDSAEAIAVAPYLLPRTGAIFGRSSKRNSHWLYYSPLAQTVSKATVQFKDPKCQGPSAILLELPIGAAGHGAQTVFPPSTHPSGEAISWELNGDPTAADGDELRRCAAVAAVCALVARYWPPTGSGHHDAALVVGGFLARAGMQAIVVRVAAEAIAKAAGSNRWRELSRTAKDAAEACAQGKHAHGFPALCETFGKEVADRIAEWLQYTGDMSDAAPAASAPSPPPQGSQARPEIYVIPGELPRVVDEAENALLAVNGDIYQRGGMIVRPALIKLAAADDRKTAGWRLIPMTLPHMTEILTRTANFLKHDARRRGWVSTNAPQCVTETYLARSGHWRLPVLTAVATAPFLRGDGTICEAPGYDPATGILLKLDKRTKFAAIPPNPSEKDAREAIETLAGAIETFPFVSGADRAVMLSAILTTLDRRSMVAAPMHAFTAPTAGTGKSLLVDIVSVIATGRDMSVISQGRTEEELEKRLGAELLAGASVISIDNCEKPLQSSFLCQSLTQTQLNIRVLGLSTIVETLNIATIFATGNNLMIVGDLTRRTLLCSLDAGCERPELRHFDTNALASVRSERGRLVAAGLTLLRAWHAQSNRIALPAFGSFEEWSYRIREPLVWVGQDDPCETVTKIREGDPEREGLCAVIEGWQALLGTENTYTVQQIINRGLVEPSFQMALMTVAGNRTGSMVDNQRLGRWLSRVAGRVVPVGSARLSLVREGVLHGYPLWKLCGRK
jgi:hypothetical protein